MHEVRMASNHECRLDYLGGSAGSGKGVDSACNGGSRNGGEGSYHRAT